MINYELVLTVQAKIALVQIHNYIKFERKSSRGPYVIEKIERHCKTIRLQPELFGPVVWNDSVIDYRMSLQWNYKIYYFIDSTLKQVVVVDVCHGARLPWEGP